MSLSRNSEGGIGVEAFRAAASFDAAKLKNSTVSHTYNTLSRRNLLSFIVVALFTWTKKNKQNKQTKANTPFMLFSRVGEKRRKRGGEGGALGYDLQGESTVSRLSARRADDAFLFMTTTAATDSYRPYYYSLSKKNEKIKLEQIDTQGTREDSGRKGTPISAFLQLRDEEKRAGIRWFSPFQQRKSRFQHHGQRQRDELALAPKKIVRFGTNSHRCNENSEIRVQKTSKISTIRFPRAFPLKKK